ncbi:MAG: sugar-binding protein [Armatimonadota bacterium]|nr:sugar-binding protein [Armatimonadota bacterium]
MTDLNRVAAICLLTLTLILLICVGVSASGGRVLFLSAWDDTYLYIGFVVDDPNITGVNKSPNSKPWEDDDIELFIDTKHEKATAPGPNTYRMAVSSAGGSGFAVGKDGAWQPLKIFTYKYGSTIQGTINNAEDADRGFSVEIALPWAEIGGKPEIGQTVGINVLRIIRGETEGFVTLSPETKSVGDLYNPSKWIALTFTGPGANQTLSSGTLVCPKLAGAAPLIDGLPKNREWQAAAALQIGQPQAPDATASTTTTQPTERVEAKESVYPAERLVLTPYYYWYQADSRKSVPVEHVQNPDGSCSLTDQPISGVGPWMSYDNVQWHKNELQEIRKAGIDVILPVYRGDTSSRKGYADRGLSCLAQALKELKAEGKDYPLVAMFFDTGAMSAAYGAKPDLKDAEVQRSFYGMISAFFSRIPEEFLLVSQLDSSRARINANVIVLSDSRNFADLDSSFVKYCDDMFTREFGGAKILWVGETGFKEKVSNLDGYISFGAGLEPKFDDSGWLDLAAVGPGFDESASVSKNPRIRSREGGKTYQNDWSALLDKKPDWIFIDSWNGLCEGSEICPTVQYGYNYTEMTAVQAMRFRGMRELDAAFLRNNVPPVIVPQAIHQVDLAVKNVGVRPWRSGQGFALSYRWFQNDKFFDDGIVKVPLMRNVLPGHTVNLSTGVIAQDRNGQTIPPGVYELHFEILQMPDKWFADAGDVPLVVPVRVGLPTEPKARFISSTLPAVAKTGGSYPFRTIIRNDGAVAWKRGSSVEILCRLYKVQDAPERNVEPIDLKPVKIPLANDIEPGRLLDFQGTLTLVDKDGKAIPARSQDDLWSYRVRWVLWADKKWLGESDGSPFCQTIDVVSADVGAQFLSCQMPKEIEAGKPVTASVTLKNSGSAPWKGGQVQLGYRWIRPDGSEATSGAKSVSLKSAAPGQALTVQAKVTAPEANGQYCLVWDVAQNGVWASTTPSVRGAETLVIPVTVKKR